MANTIALLSALTALVVAIGGVLATLAKLRNVSQTQDAHSRAFAKLGELGTAIMAMTPPAPGGIENAPSKIETEPPK